MGIEFAEDKKRDWYGAVKSRALTCYWPGHATSAGRPPSSDSRHTATSAAGQRAGAAPRIACLNGVAKFSGSINEWIRGAERPRGANRRLLKKE